MSLDDVEKEIRERRQAKMAEINEAMLKWMITDRGMRRRIKEKKPDTCRGVIRLEKRENTKEEKCEDGTHATIATEVATPDTSSRGYIYCLSNPSIPGLLKIGMTSRTPEARAKELYTTGVAVPFNIEFTWQVDNPLQKEKQIHNLLANCRVESREFFRISVDEAIRLINTTMKGNDIGKYHSSPSSSSSSASPTAPPP